MARAVTDLEIATILEARLTGPFATTTVRIVALLGLLVFGIQPTSATDTKCIENPTVECVAEIAAQSARTLDRGTHWEAILGNLAAAGRTEVASELAYRLPKVSWPSR